MVVMPDSPFRLARLEQVIGGTDAPLDVAFWQRLLGDHAMFPLGVCCHPDPRATVEPERYATVMAVIMEPAAKRMWLASGNPCTAPFEELDYAEFLGKAPAVRAPA
jgi:isopenicillin-N N-acyltransferase-like protein